MFEQIDLFSNSDNLYKIRKPLRIIEFFAGIGFQRIGIQRVFPNAQSWKICEWAIPSIIAYDVIHSNKGETCDYINDKGWLVDFLLNKGVSADYNVPAEKKQLQRMPLDKLNRIYQAIVRTNNLVNIMNVRGEDLEIVDTDKYEYCCSYSFPCQDLSLSGKQAGMSVSQKEGGTRSGLVWEFLRIIKECKEKPQLLLMENVPQIHSKKVNDDFYVLQLELQKLGYKNIWKDMNSKDYGIPQSRNRTFMLSIYDKNADYVFPEKEELKLCLQDLLEDEVDEKYFLSKKMLDYCLKENDFNRKDVFLRNIQTTSKGISPTLTTKEGSQPTNPYVVVGLKRGYSCEVKEEQDNPKDVDVIGNYSKSNFGQTSIVNKKGIAPTVTENHGQVTAIAIKNNNSKGYELATEGDGIDISTRMQHHRGTVQKGMAQTLTCQGGNNVGVVVNDRVKKQIVDDGIAHTILTNGNFTGTGVNLIKNNLRIRKLTPLECCRLMNAPDQVDFKLKEANFTDSQRYHIYGDGLVAVIPQKIFEKLKED